MWRIPIVNINIILIFYISIPVDFPAGISQTFNEFVENIMSAASAVVRDQTG